MTATTKLRQTLFISTSSTITCKLVIKSQIHLNHTETKILLGDEPIIVNKMWVFPAGPLTPCDHHNLKTNLK